MTASVKPPIIRIPVTIPNMKISDLVDEMKSNYLTYAEYVIRDRAIPEIRDGLKPVHRRILWSMWESGCKSNSNYKKSARIVGNAMGKYHPHGDSSVYGAMVRLAQDFVLNVPLIDGKGNFGSSDGTSVAAPRYTEARLSKFAEEVFFADIGENTVEFIDNYAGDEKEPLVLPARIPMILLTSVTGIAVGMATDIPPHNLNEVCDATIAYVDNPAISYAELVNIIGGPDSPLGGLLKAGDYAALYEKGVGTFKWRANTDFESDGKNKYIIIKSIPMSSYKADIIKEIATAVNEEKIAGITEVRDESTKTGMRICVELSGKSDHTSVLNSIYNHTRLQSSIKYNSVVICDNQPKTIGLKSILENFLKFRRDVVKKRTEFRKDKAESRKEIVDGILKASANVDKAVEIIKEATDASKTCQKLEKELKLTPRQAEHVFNMPLRRFSKLDTGSLSTEQVELSTFIKEQNTILTNATKVNEIIKDEVLEIKEKFGHPRKIIVVPDFDSITPKSVVKQEDVALIFLSDGCVKSTPLSGYRLQKRRGSGLNVVNTTDDVYPVYVTQASTHDEVMVFTNKGNRYRMSVYAIPASDRVRKPQSLQDFIPGFDPSKEKVVAVTKSELTDKECLVMIGKKGIIRKLINWAVTGARDSTTNFYPVEVGGDVVSAIVAKLEDNIVIVTKKGMMLYTSLKWVTLMKTRKSAGILGMRLSPGDEILNVSVADEKSFVITISNIGYGKRTAISSFLRKGRGCRGLACMNIGKEDELVFGQAVNPGDDEPNLLVVTNQNSILRMKFNDVSDQGRLTRGSMLKKMKEGEFVTAISVE